MRSEIGTFSRILMEVFVCFFLLFYSSYVNGEGSTCKLQKTGNCTNAIIMIDKKSAEEETSFNVYIYQQGKKELAVVLIYENGYICLETNGYTCTSPADGTFSVNLECEPLQDVTLVGDGQQPVKCQPMENSPMEITSNSKESNCCPDKRESGNSVDGSRQKRCPCPNDNPKENGSLVVIIVISLISAISAAGVVGFVVFVLHRKQKLCWRKINRNEYFDKGNAYSKDPLTTESIKC